MNEILISLIIPFKKANKNVEVIIDSFIKCKLSKIELILVNDGDKKKNFKLKKNKNLNIIKLKKNYGVSYARNIGIKRSNGKYIIFCDSDDKINFKNLEKLSYIILNKLKNQKPELLSYNLSSEKFTNQVNNRLIDNQMNNKKLLSKIKKIKINKFRFVCWRYVYEKSFLIKKKIFFSNNLRTYEDVVFLCKVFLNVEKIYNLNLNIIQQKNENNSLSDENLIPSKLILYRTINACEEIMQININNKNQKNFINLVIKKILNDKLPLFLIKKINTKKIERIKNIFNYLNLKKYNIKNFQNKIILRYKELIKKKIKRKNENYIFCFSYWSIIVTEYLIKNGYKVRAFLDNDRNKSNKFYQKLSLKVQEPISIRRYINDEKLYITVINSSYKTYLNIKNDLIQSDNNYEYKLNYLNLNIFN